MKCPKCGYTSFESYDACKKCSADLVEFRKTHGLTPLVLPNAVRASMAAELLGHQAGDAGTDESGSDMFAFDLPTEQPGTAAASPSASADPFAFNDTPTPAAAAFSFDHAPVPPQDDPFAALLETTPQQAAPAPPPAEAAQGFELNSFSWDDTPVPGQAEQPQAGGKTDDDDFNSLFGELGNGTKK